MTRDEWTKLAVAGTALVAAGVLGFRFFRAGSGVSGQAFFYDLSQQKLFTGPRESIPPIRGVDGPEEDAVRAVVVSVSGKPEDKDSWQVAYLEKYSPELKRQMQQAQATGTSPAMGRGMAQAHRFVKRLKDADWSSLNTEEGERIVAEWTTLGVNGATPVLCSP